MRAAADKKIALYFDPTLPQGVDFPEEGNRIEDHAIADDAAASGTQDSAGHQLQNELPAIDDDCVSGVMPTGIAGNDREILREHVDNLAFAFVAPLSAYDDRSFAVSQNTLQ